MIQTGAPIKNGMYVAYVEEGVSIFPKKEFATWSNDIWNRPGTDQPFRHKMIYGWVGPLPEPNITNLRYKDKKYAIGTMMGNEFGKYKAGVFNTLDEALFFDVVNEGDFVWEIHPSGKKKPVAKWSDCKIKWIFRKGKKK